MPQMSTFPTGRAAQPQESLVKLSGRELRTILESEHPLYVKNKKLWQDMFNLYANEEIENFIFRHPREKETHYLKRKERAYCFNYLTSIIELITSFIYSRSIQRQWESAKEREARIRQLRLQQIVIDQRMREETERQQREEFEAMQAQQNELAAATGTAPKLVQPPTQPQAPAQPGVADDLPPLLVEDRVQQLLEAQAENFEELQDFWENIDLRGTSIDDFTKMAFVFSQVFGHCDAFVDMMQTDQEVLTEQDRKQLQLRPYAFLIFPLDMLNWEVGPDGKFMWVRWREKIVGDTGPFQKRSKKPSYRYYTWTREEWFIHEIHQKDETSIVTDPQLVAHGENPIGEVPVARFFAKKHPYDPLIGISPFKEVFKINVEIQNISSLLDEELYQKTFNILVMQMPSQKKSAVEVGNNNVLLWEGEAQPYYLAPSSEPGKFMMELISLCVKEIYRIAKLGGETGVQEARSGIAYTWEFNQTNRMLADKADMMERGEYELHRLWAKWLGLKWEGLIDYPDDFNVERFEEEIQRATQLKQAVRSPEFKRFVERKLAARGMTKAPNMERARVFAEIDVLNEERPMFFPPM